MSIKELLFSFQGRIGRKTFWLWNVTYYALIIGFATVANKIFPNIAYLILPVFLLIVLIPDLAITAKRWHDRNKSVWWLVLNVPLVLGRMTMPIGNADVAAQAGMMEALVSLVALVCGVWILVECGFMKGSVGNNDYGPEAE
ncbi:DUF805 domain-containing protein [Vibrio sp. SA48]|uniref:DUF805 domain-containing protein n=1 Tax=Vibrio sp. S12_S33 TaxID=2720223 RepID=UPI0017825267|nr:DUF805 domain-containing protein [Vibrio sp. S12_S33]MBD1564612.1 DUF805 domain-containing protein [Vibrio sp. S12_S33]